MSSRRALGIAAVGYATVVWGLLPIVLKQVEMPTLAFATYRLWFGILIYAVALLAMRRRLRWEVIRVCWPGGLLFAADLVLTFNAFRITTAANATIIGAISPVFIAIGAARWFGERIGRKEAMLMAASIAGVGLVALGSFGSPAWRPLGDAFAAASTLSWTGYWLFSKRVRTKLRVGTLEYMTTVMVVAGGAVTVVTVASGVSLAPPQGEEWIWLAYTTVISGAAGHLALAWSHRHVEAWLGSLVMQSMPVVAATAGWILLNEAMTPLSIAGGAVVLAATGAIVARERFGSRPQEEPTAPAALG
ncbi:MAG: DMT family transporter [Actinomycetota bacterium]